MTLFERCCAAAYAVKPARGDALDIVPSTADRITRAVLQTLLDHTESPRTAEEVSRVLAEGV